MQKPASELGPGDQIRAPKGERGWLGHRLLTVISVEQGRADKRGPWLNVRCSFHSPYEENKISESVFRFRPQTVIEVYFGLPQFTAR